MTDLDTSIRAALDRAVTTAPAPVSIETILARGSVEVALEPQPGRAGRRWALPGAAAVVVAAGLTVALLPRGGGPSEPPTGIEAVDTAETVDAADAPGRTDQAGPADAPDPADEAEVRRVVVGEGRWLREIVPAIAAQLPAVTADELWAALDAAEPRSPVAPPADDLADADVPGLPPSRLRWEGLLLAGEHRVDADATAEEVVASLHAELVDAATDLGYERAPARLGRTPHELVVVASLVEATGATTDDDRARIARVLHNRLDEDLPLALDAAYLYANQDRGIELTAPLLGAPGPYSLRLTPGLPPTPIAAPSRAALRAAIEPATGPWLFFVVVDEAGNHAFATTGAEHNENVRAAHERGLLD